MNKCYQKIVISTIFIIILLTIYCRTNVDIPKWMINTSNYAPTNKGFTGIKIKDLIQHKSFYTKNRENTIKYLTKVYPTGKESFNSLGDLELASFYNSLSYYYHSKEYNLPYPPQGWFFNDCSYQKYNKPIFFSDSDESKECLNLSNFISSNLEQGGPGLAFFDGRTIQRDIYFPNGLSVTRKNDKDVWNYVSGQIMNWNYPKNWQNGFDDYSFIEVTHTDAKPSNGIQSPGWWWNVVTGSGIFLNIGKTLKAVNKLDAVYQLLNLSDKELLIKWYSTSDINQIILGLTTDCDNSLNYCNNDYTDCNNICSVNKIGLMNNIDLPLGNFYQELLRFTYDNKSNEKDLIKGILSARRNDDYRLSRVSQSVILDETLFFLGLNTGFDTIQFVMDPNLNGYYVFEILDLRIPKEYILDSMNRQYNFFDENKNYKLEFIDEFIANFIEKDLITIRDPLDLYNMNKTLKCNIFGMFNSSDNDKNRWDNFYCENNISADFKLNNSSY